MIASLILATWLTVVPVPGEEGVYNIIGEDMATQPPISDLTRTADAMYVGSPTQTRTSYNFDDLEQNYPIREVVPREQRVRVPIEERMYMQQYDLENRQRELSIRGQELNQGIAAKTFEYDQKILNQAEGAMSRLGEFDPASPDFDQNFAEFQAQNPLAFQNPAFRQLADRLVTTRQQILDTGARRESAVSAQGTSSLTAYQEALKQGKTPFEAQALAADAEARERALQRQQQQVDEDRRQLAMKGGPQAVGAYSDALSQEQERVGKLQSLRQQLVDSGDQDLVAAFDQKYQNLSVDPTIALGKAAQVANQEAPPTRADYTALLSANNRLIAAAGSYEDLTPEQKSMYDFNQEQANRYIQSQGGEPIRQSAPAVSEGRTATNHSTGEKIIFRNGKWEPVK